MCHLGGRRYRKRNSQKDKVERERGGGMGEEEGEEEAGEREEAVDFPASFSVEWS